jgi:glycosyltransferase involved in cell wall biosynthesis
VTPRMHTRVLLDATAIPAARGGVGRYVDQLAQGLDQIGTALTVVCQQRDAEIFSALAPHSRIVPASAQLGSRPVRLAWEQTGLPWLAQRLRVAVIHSPHYTMPLAAGVPVVSTLHDATFFSDRGLHLGMKGYFFRAWTRTALRRAAACVVPSQATAEELVRHAHAIRGRLVVAHHGVDQARFYPPTAAQVQALRDHLGLGERPWVAFLGTLEPRKNVPALIRAFIRVSADRVPAPVLVLAGAPGWDPEIESAIAAVPPGISVLRTGHLPIDLLPALLGGAEVVCYPSLGEGFGLPVLEAMACGAAVLTTRRLSLPEVGGSAVAYSGTSVDDIASALGDLLDDPARRAELAAAGLERAGHFTWRATALAHQVAYDRAVARG